MKSNGNWCIPNGEEIMVSKENTLTFILIYTSYILLLLICANMFLYLI